MGQSDEKGGGGGAGRALRVGSTPRSEEAGPTLPAVTPRPIDPILDTTAVAGPAKKTAAVTAATTTATVTGELGLPPIGRFELHRKLGEGGMGAVYLATDPTLGRRVAIKVLHRDGGGDAEGARRRLLREAQGTAQLSHEHVIVVYEVGTHDGQVYLAMEYVAGTTLKGWQADRGWRDVLAMYRRAGTGLRAAHDAGLVHRDFKPDNVLVGDDGRLRITDFGLVAAVDDAMIPQVSSASISLRSELDLVRSMTRTGTIMGTPRYMAPEQHLGEPVDARADQFAFCVALYEAWYGQPPFAGASYEVMVAHVLAGEVRPVPPASEVPAALRDAVLRGLHRQRDDRFPSMHDLLAALEVPVAEPAPAPPTPRRRWPWLAAGLAVLVVAGIAGVRTLGRPDGSPQGSSMTAAPPVGAAGAVAPPVAPSPPPAPPAPPPAPATVDVTIDTTPQGARVVLDGDDVGATPYRGTLPRGDRAVRLVLRRAGYKPITRSITPTAAIVESVALKKQPAASGTINPF